MVNREHATEKMTNEIALLTSLLTSKTPDLAEKWEQEEAVARTGRQHGRTKILA